MTTARLARVVLSLLCLAPAFGAQPARSARTRNVILVTLDGMRWQELFSGADSVLVRDRRFVRDTSALLRAFWTSDAAARRDALVPFLTGTVATAGRLYGDRARGSRVDVTNPHRVSYPGYSELLVGFHDPRVEGNDSVPNPNPTVLQFVHERPGMRGRVAAFGSWDLFPFILDEAHSGVPVNAGFEPVGASGSARERVLDVLQTQVPARWESVRFDAFTHQYALEYLARRRPRLLYIAYGETDDFAHEGRYDEYLRAARRTDGFLRDLWRWVQSQDDYRDRTTLIVTTDHGRGAGADWTKHGADVDGAEAIWLAVLGPDTPPVGEEGLRGHFVQGQVASTVAALLGYQYRGARAVAPPLPGVTR